MLAEDVVRAVALIMPCVDDELEPVEKVCKLVMSIDPIWLGVAKSG